MEDDSRLFTSMMLSVTPRGEPSSKIILEGSIFQPKPIGIVASSNCHAYI
jgi:hypothetical protein